MMPPSHESHWDATQVRTVAQFSEKLHAAMAVDLHGQIVPQQPLIEVVAAGRKIFVDAAQALGLEPILKGGEQCPNGR